MVRAGELSVRTGASSGARTARTGGGQQSGAACGTDLALRSCYAARSPGTDISSQELGTPPDRSTPHKPRVESAPRASAR